MDQQWQLEILETAVAPRPWLPTLYDGSGLDYSGPEWHIG